MRCLHTISYPVARKDLEHPLKPFMRRDFCATCDLLPVLYRQGYSQGEPIFQPPLEPPRAKPPAEPYPLDISFVRPGDLLVQNTRPPMNDMDEGPRKKIEPAYTDLEKRTFELVEPFISYCSRTHVELNERVCRDLRPGYEDRREMKFLQNSNYGPYSGLNARDGKGWHKPADGKRTPLFLLRLDEAWKGGPGFLCAFGMDGCATQLWSYLLARKFPHLLSRPGFTIAEMVIGSMHERITDLRWSMDWKIELVLEHELTASAAVA